jgi:hypothetical protein
MAKRIRLGDVTNGTLDSLDFQLAIDGDDFVLQDKNENTVMRYDGSVGEWVLAANLNANSNNISNVSALSTDSLVIGGTLYEEDDNSPWTASAVSSDTFTLAGDYDEVIVIPQNDVVGFNQVRVNGDSTTNYRYVDNADSRTTGVSEWDFGSLRFYTTRLFGLQLNSNLSSIQFYLQSAHDTTGATQAGRYVGSSNSAINSIVGVDSGGVNRDVKARVFGRSMNI